MNLIMLINLFFYCCGGFFLHFCFWNIFTFLVLVHFFYDNCTVSLKTDGILKWLLEPYLVSILLSYHLGRWMEVKNNRICTFGINLLLIKLFAVTQVLPISCNTLSWMWFFSRSTGRVHKNNFSRICRFLLLIWCWFNTR